MKAKKVIIKEERGREKVKRYSAVLSAMSDTFSKLPLKERLRLFDAVRMKQGNAGKALRYTLARSICKKCGENVSISECVWILNLDNIEFGSNVSVNQLCYLQGLGGITIGNNVSIGHMCTIMSLEHIYDDPEIPIKDQGLQAKEVIIEDDVWIGAKATILMGVHIGKGAIIGAGAVVTRDVKAFDVVGGVPARTIRNRKI